MKVFSASFLIASVLPTLAYSQTADMCNALAKTAYDVEARYESADQYRQSYSALETLYYQYSEKSAFENAVSSQGAGGSWKMLKASYEKSTGKSASSSSLDEIFSSVNQTSFAEFALSETSSVEKREFVREVVTVLESCAALQTFVVRARVRTH